jgi:HK97 family phage major capsid protein
MLGRTAIASGFDTENHTGGSIGGFTMQWLGELTSGTRQKGKIRRIQLTAKKGAIFTQASNELAADAPNFDGDLVSTLVQAIGWSLDYYAIRGTGAGQPLGVLNSPALVTVAAEGGQAVDSFVAANVLKMFGRLHPASHKNAVWITNPACLPKLMGLYIPAFNVAGTEHVGAVTGPLVTVVGPNQYLMLGLPLLISEKASALGDVGDLMLMDFSQYVLGIRKEITVERSNAPGWTEDASDWRAIIRFDGQGKWSAPFTPVKGADSLSPFVTLAAR